MKVKVIETLDSYTLTQPITSIVRCKVELEDQAKAYLICYKHNDHVMFLQGHYFLSEELSKKFFDLHIKRADLVIDMTPEEELEYSNYQSLTNKQMEEYIHG